MDYSNCDRSSQVCKGSFHLGARPKSDEMDCADFRLMASATFELAESFFPSGNDRHFLPVIQSHELIELFFHLRLISDLDQEGGAQLVLLRQQGIVHIQLILDLGRFDDSFGPDHFLNLKLQRFPVFEHHGDKRADRNAPPLFERDDLLAKGFSLPFILFVRNDIAGCDRLHCCSLFYF